MSKKSSSAIILGVIVLGVLAAVLFNKIYLKNSATSPSLVSQVPASNYQVAEPPVSSSSNETKAYPAVDVAALVSEFPPPNASKAANSAFYQKVAALAVDSATLDVTSCKPEPPVMLVHLNKAFTLQNNDTSVHKIVHTQFTLTAQPNSSQQVSPSFQGAGVYGYSCDGQPVGMFYVTQ